MCACCSFSISFRLGVHSDICIFLCIFIAVRNVAHFETWETRCSDLGFWTHFTMPFVYFCPPRTAQRFPARWSTRQEINNAPALTYLQAAALRQNKRISSITTKQNFQFVAFFVWLFEPKRCHSASSKGTEVCFLVFLFGNLWLLTSITIYWPRCYIASYYPDLRRIVFGNAHWNFPAAKALNMRSLYASNVQLLQLDVRLIHSSLIAIRIELRPGRGGVVVGAKKPHYVKWMGCFHCPSCVY